MIIDDFKKKKNPMEPAGIEPGTWPGRLRPLRMLNDQ